MSSGTEVDSDGAEWHAERRRKHAERMAAPPAIFMSVENFSGSREVGVQYAHEYTYEALCLAALRWAEEQAESPELAAQARQRMATVIAESGLTPEHLTSGYLSSWTAFLRGRYRTASLPRRRVPADVMEDVREHLSSGAYYDVVSPDPLFTDVKVSPRVSYYHTALIDGVRWSLPHLYSKMEEIENCPGDRGFATMHGSGEDALLEALLTKHAGLTSGGGYHSSPRYEEGPWEAFKEQLAAVMRTV